MTHAIVLFSGGLDSTACLYWAKKNYEGVTIMSFLYGSKEDEVIKRTNDKFASLLSLNSKIISLPFLNNFAKAAGSTLTTSADLPEFGKFDELNDITLTKESAESVWVPGRNILFLSIAASAADSLKTSVDIIFGGNKEEGETFPDNSPEFVDRMNAAIELGCMNEVKVLAPFSEKMKYEIVSFLNENEAKYEFSSSCYQISGWSEKEKGKPIHCGKCESCLRRRRAFQHAKIRDKTEYAV